MNAHRGEVEVSEASQALPAQAKCVVIGAGIVGNCLVGHLARLGWTDIVQLDKGPLPNPGGSTGHASNFIFPTDHNKEMALLTLESQRQYVAMDMNSTCGGIEVARTAGTDGGVQPADDVGQGVGHRRPAADARLRSRSSCHSSTTA